MHAKPPSPRAATSFRYSVDRNRSRILLSSEDANEARPDQSVMVYEYLDSGEKVVVPRIWQNLPGSVRAEDALARAKAAEEKAERLIKNPPLGLIPDDLEGLVCLLRANAERHRSLASDLIAADSR